MLCFQGALAQRQPWWKSQLFLREPVLFGTWDGVFTSCMINIFGVVLFLRTGWLVVSDELVALQFLVRPWLGKLRALGPSAAQATDSQSAKCGCSERKQEASTPRS